ncbi:MAG: Maf family protein [Desulfotignum sp.]|nr:Maf family protein [Desulfotignum sp.]
MDPHRLVLASRSPRRRDLLTQMGLSLEIQPADVDETLSSELSPAEYVQILAEKKARYVMALRRQSWVLGADTIVVKDGTVLGKPKNQAEAISMLECLSDGIHSVFTGYAVGRHTGRHMMARAIETQVVFKVLTNPEILWYTGTREPYDKAGGYAVQGLGAFMVKEIRGSWANVVGLPVCEVIQTLASLGAIQFQGHVP